MKKVLLLTNNDKGTYLFRKELITELLKSFDVYVSVPTRTYVNKIASLGCTVLQTKINRRGINPISDLVLLLSYRKLIRSLNPSVILSYTVKPNIYGGIAARKYKNQIATITGLGTAIENKNILSLFILKLYKYALKSAQAVFIQNEEILTKLVDQKIVDRGKAVLISGSGINLGDYDLLEYPSIENPIRFMFVGRLMKNKGIEMYLDAAKTLMHKYSNLEFNIFGQCEDNFYEKVKEYELLGVIKYYGFVDDMRPHYKQCNAIIHPSYHEGMSNVLLEAAASGRPIIASNISGCKEILDDGISGFTFESKNQSELNNTIEKFLSLSYLEKEIMGIRGREKVVRQFDRSIVVDKYMEQIKKIMEEKQ